MVITDNESLYKQAEWYHDHGHPHLKGIGRGEEKKMREGFNFRMNELQAAIGLTQLEKLPEIIKRQKENKRKIKEGIKNISWIEFREILDEQGDIATFLTMYLPDKEKGEKLKEKMKEKEVNPATLNYWHFTANIEMCGGKYPKSQDILERSVVLELKTIMTDEEIERTIEVIKSF